MEKETLQKIKNLAAFIFDNRKYERLMRYVNTNRFTDARLLISNESERLDLLVHLHDDNEILLSQYKKVDELENIVMDLQLDEKEYEEGKQINNIT